MRPQLLDRFGLSVNVGTLVDTDVRLKMVLDRMRFDNEPAALLADAQQEMEDLQASSHLVLCCPR
jgi:magnesium chelatase subunit I